MDLSDPTSRLIAIGLIIVLLTTFFLLQPTALVKWIQKKIYQYEVTFALYMLTPREKVVINTILFLGVSMLIIACTLYLPSHLAIVTARGYYYLAGHVSSFSDNLGGSLTENSLSGGEALQRVAANSYHAATGWAQVAYQAAVNKTVGSASIVSGGASAVDAVADAATKVAESIATSLTVS